MECNGCEERQKELFACDGCNVGLCKACAGLTSSEVKVLQLKERVMLYHCKKCKDFDTHTLLQNTIKDKSNIIASKDEIIYLLKKQITELEIKQNESETRNIITYSQITKQDKKNSEINVNIPSLIIKPKKQQNTAKTKTDMREKINPAELKVAIRGTRDTINGNVIVKCQNRSDLETLKREAESKLQDYEVHLTKMRKPRFKIIGYEGGLDIEQINKCLREQNKFIKEIDDLEITYIKHNKNNSLCTIYGECNASLFHRFMAMTKVFIGWERYPVYEDLSIMRCFKCQELYHKSDKCLNKVVCEFCSGDHDIRDCPKSQKKCNNCIKANNKFKTNYKTEHAANDPLCPSYQYLINVLKSKIDYVGNGS